MIEKNSPHNRTTYCSGHRDSARRNPFYEFSDFIVVELIENPKRFTPPPKEVCHGKKMVLRRFMTELREKE
jgi:hypothetical protein